MIRLTFQLLVVALFLSSLPVLVYGQQIVLHEDFEDQDLTQNPTWTGNTGNFTFFEDNGNFLLRLNDTGASGTANRSQMRTVSTTAYGSWEFYYRQDVAPSNTNRAFFFLISDRENINYLTPDQSEVNGYALRTGDNTAERRFRLVRFNNGNQTVIAESGTIVEENQEYQVRVTRDENGDWQIFVGEGYGSSPVVDSPVVNDNTFTTSSWFGMLMTYSSGNNQNFFFDDIIIENSEDFTAADVNVESSTELDVTFNYPIEETSLDPFGFSVDQGVGSPVSVNLTTDFVVRLTFADPFNDGDYTITINDVENIFGGVIGPNTQLNFSVTNTFEVASVEALQADRIAVEFTEPPNAATLIPANFGISGIGSPNNIDYDADTDPNTVFLELNTPLAIGDYVLTIENVTSTTGWPLTGDTVFDFSVENMFFVTGFEMLNTQEFDITFSQNVQAGTAVPANFEIAGIGSPNTVQLEDPNRVRIIYNSPVPPGRQDLVINNLMSTDGWVIEENTTLEISIFEVYEDGDLVITEFFYRVPISWRTPEFDRPRYVEIYNRSDKLLNLRNFTLNGENISVDKDLPIETGEYLVLTRGKPVFEERFGQRNFVEADGFPTLNLTTSSSITLQTGDGDLVETLTYFAGTWGGNGVALERLSMDAGAGFRDNWAESEDLLFGSPGLPNTVSAPTAPPEVAEIRFPLPGIVWVAFSRTLSPDAVDASSFSINNGISIDYVKPFDIDDYDDEDPDLHFNFDFDRTLEFGLNQDLEDQTEYMFSYQNIEDIFENEVSGTGQFPFMFQNPFRILSAELAGENTLSVQFTMSVEQPSVSASAFELSNGTPPNSAVLSPSTIITLEFGDAFDVGEHQIYVNSIESRIGWMIEPDSEFTFFSFEDFQEGDIVLNEFMYRPPSGYARYVELHNVSNRFLNLKDWELRRAEGASSNGGVFSERDLPIEPGGFVVISPDTATLAEIFGSRPWFQMNNYPGLTQTTGDHIRLIDSNGSLADFLEYDPPIWGGNGVALERRSVDAATNSPNNWGESLDELFGTPGLPNTVAPDDDRPQLLSVDFIDAETVSVQFSGAIDQEATGTGNFGINQGLSVTSVNFTTAEMAELTLNDEMSSGTEYTVTVTNITDIFGNALQQAQLSFTYYLVETALPGDIFINEFMYNEPEDYSRYIELYNASDKAVDVAGWQQANDTGTRRTLTNNRTILAPDSYIVITPNENLLAIFPGIPLLNAGSNLSALKNGGDDIVITNAEGTTLDSVRYTPSWGGNGVALERRRISVPSTSAENWAESPNELLGTPGRRNDVSRDFDFTAESVQALSRNLVRVTFSADIRESDAVRSNFSVNGTNPSSVILDTSFVVLLEFSSSLSPGSRTLTINNMHSIAGFRIPDNSRFNFTVYDEFAEGDILINEFMYRPPEGYTRYVELINRSGKLLNLRNWRLQRRQVTTEPRRVISTEDLTLEPGGFIVLTADTAIMREIFGERNFHELASFPNFTVTTPDQIRLFTDADQLADSLQYTPSEWGGNGVALERVSTALPSTLADNWEESPNELLGTPGLPNEVMADTTPPEVLGVTQFNDRGFQIHFNKRLESDSATDPQNYSISPTLPVSLIMLENSTVTLLTGGNLVNDMLYTISVSGIRDLFGNEMEPVTLSIRYLEFGTAEPQQLIINEILYRRLQSGSPEFVELYNRSDQNIDLGGWTLSDATGSAVIPQGTAIRENDYLVFTDTESFASESENIIFMSNFRPLNNNGDAVVLKNSSDVVIDSLFYQASWADNPPGISLERKDPAALSIDPANWARSSAESGSTPAAENSRFQLDQTPPEIIFANIFHPDSIEVYFSEFVDLTQTAGNNLNAAFLNRNRTENQTVQQINAGFFINGTQTDLLFYDPAKGNRIVLDPAGATPGEEITIRIENFGDFQGNIQSQEELPVSQPLSEGDLVFNEIMYNPIADNRDGLPDQSEYIEIYNRRSYAISLEGIFLHDEPDENNQVTRIDPVTTTRRWIPAHGYAVFYPESEEVTFAESRTGIFFDVPPEMERFSFRANRTSLSLPNAGRQVYLADSTLTTIDMVDYSPDWQNPNIVDTRGIALERINPDLETNNPSNWGSNTSVLGGTPGFENTLFQEPGAAVTGVGIELTPNPFSPDGDGFEDNLFINYAFDEPDYLLRIRIFDRYGRLVRNLAEARPAGFQGSVIWDGRTDNGQRNRIGIYIVFVEAFNSQNGRNLTFRKTAVLARQF